MNVATIDNHNDTVKRSRTLAIHFILHLQHSLPPFENPWLGAPTAPLGEPVISPNAQLMREVYGAHSASRVLNPVGLIDNIINLYQWYSFSFSPDLLRHIRQTSVNVYQRILEGDKLSQVRLGHGNALAQSYSGAILPLMSPSEMEGDIKLGLESFEIHFRRKSEGFWLPELGFNLNVADILIKNSIRFVYVSPWQIQAVGVDGTGTWTALGPHPARDSFAFRLKRPEGDLLLIPYHHEFHEEVLQRSILKNSRLFENSLNHHAQPQGGYLTAVHRGELFGHLEPFADMCLADLIHRNLEEKTLHFCNPAHLLEKSQNFPLAKLKRGEKEKGTSWSCFHGVARWYRDCGDHSLSKEGWHQNWREDVHALLSSFSKSAWGSFREYLFAKNLKVLETMECFLPVAEGIQSTVEWIEAYPELAKDLPLLEGMFWAIRSLNSFGTFYSDPAQDPVLRVLSLALRAEELLCPLLKEDWRQKLESGIKKLPTNMAEKNGEYLWKLLQTTARKDQRHAAAFFILDHIMRKPRNQTTTLGYWELMELIVKESEVSKNTKEYTGKLTLKNSRLPQVNQLNFLFTEDLREGFSLGFSDSGSKTLQSFDLLTLSTEEHAKSLLRLRPQEFT